MPEGHDLHVVVGQTATPVYSQKSPSKKVDFIVGGNHPKEDIYLVKNPKINDQPLKLIKSQQLEFIITLFA